MIDPQTLRFVNDVYLEVEALTTLPYAPRAPLSPASVDEKSAGRLAQAVLAFEAQHGATDYLAPAIPALDRDLESWLQAHARVLRATAEANGTRGLAHKPLIASLAPGQKALFEPPRLIEPLNDLPLDGIYVQPLRLSPTRDSVDKLVAYVRFLMAAQEIGVPVLAGRVGAFGLILEALGIAMFDSGLGQAEGFDLAALNRRASARSATSDAPRGSRRIYLRALKTTLPNRIVEQILNERGLRASFACDLECCRWRDQEALGDRCREHYLRVRQDEVSVVERRPTAALRLSDLHDSLVEARDLAIVVSRTLQRRQQQPPSFEHLDRWLAVIATLTEMPAAA